MRMGQVIGSTNRLGENRKIGPSTTRTFSPRSITSWASTSKTRCFTTPPTGRIFCSTVGNQFASSSDATAETSPDRDACHFFVVSVKLGKDPGAGCVRLPAD